MYLSIRKIHWLERHSTRYYNYYFWSKTAADEDVQGLLFRQRSRYQHPCQYAVLYDHRTAITEAVIIVGDRGTLDADILTALRQVKSCDLHPLLLCSIVSEALLKENLNEIERYAEKVSVLTKLTGQHEHSYVPNSDVFEIDFMTTTRSLNFSNKRIADEARIVKSILRSLEVIQKFGDEIDTDLGKIDDQLVLLNFQHAVEHHVEICRDLLGTCEYVEKRIATLIQVV